MQHQPIDDELEEILENMWVFSEEKGLPLTADTYDQEQLRELAGQDMVRFQDGEVLLTDEGRREAEKCIRRHRLAERLLSDILQSPQEQVHSSGCKFEHGLRHELEERVCTMLGHPGVCPHGKPIPKGRCCRKSIRESGQLLAPLTEVSKGETTTVAYLQSTDNADMRKLMSIGALPGTSITLKQSFPSYHLEIGNAMFAVDKELAGQIHVRRGSL
jgi:DtxR family Mn-dependent transcriptional regulator